MCTGSFRDGDGVMIIGSFLYRVSFVFLQCSLLCANRLIPAPSSQQLFRWKGVLVPRIRRDVPLRIAIEIFPLTQAITWEYGLFHFPARQVTSLARNFCASFPSIPSVVAMKGVKCLLLSRHGSRYFFFFSFSCFSRSFSTVEFLQELESGYVILMSTMQSNYLAQNPRIPMSPRSCV